MRLESILRDVGFGVRLCRRHEIVTAAALISLSFAIGACTAGLSLIVSMLSTSRTVLNLDLQVNWRMLVFLAGLGSLVTFLFGLGPALRASAVAPGDALNRVRGNRRHGSVCSVRWCRAGGIQLRGPVRCWPVLDQLRKAGSMEE
jgi:ABC-type antimicrobial peptide transport system permease subunit